MSGTTAGVEEVRLSSGMMITGIVLTAIGATAVGSILGVSAGMNDGDVFDDFDEPGLYVPFAMGVGALITGSVLWAVGSIKVPAARDTATTVQPILSPTYAGVRLTF